MAASLGQWLLCLARHLLIDIPNTAIVPPNLVNTPKAPMFCLVNVFCAAATIVPTPPVIIVDDTAAETASFGWYVLSSCAMATFYGQ
jgi:hypothetical protein